MISVSTSAHWMDSSSKQEANLANTNKSSSGKSKNKTWTRKAKEETDKSKKELASFVKKAVAAGVRKELKSIDRKRKSDSDDESMDLNAYDLDNFNYGDLEKLTIEDPDFKIPKKKDTKVAFAKKATIRDVQDGMYDDIALSDDETEDGETKDDISV